ncbi:ubiquinone biosynthesis protein COQ4 homolog, mitochondrial isoform X2 [Amyelois transitella]|uniref:ubiquinone biosynthesis protein COQ4 homolog, mitochondrial isoform X2 n=1 Tax=Amyelois transitella TaxID=680683 RepID=UPI00067BB671|nr:ubiquinone biosynthesis protein COQ4 homolog, mitochondrial isoform X2 [Amyelois transitella]
MQMRKLFKTKMLPFKTLLRRFSVSTARNTGFIEEMQRNYIPTSPFQRTMLSCGSALVSLLNPHRGDMIACLGEVTGESAMKYMRQKMLETSEGAEILKEMPRINSSTVSFETLSQMPSNTIGRIYADFMRDNKITADSRLLVQFIDDPELAYVMQRYREVHDLVHATLFMKTTMLGEVHLGFCQKMQVRQKQRVKFESDCNAHNTF